MPTITIGNISSLLSSTDPTNEPLKRRDLRRQLKWRVGKHLDIDPGRIVVIYDPNCDPESDAVNAEVKVIPENYPPEKVEELPFLVKKQIEGICCSSRSDRRVKAYNLLMQNHTSARSLLGPRDGLVASSD